MPEAGPSSETQPLLGNQTENERLRKFCEAIGISKYLQIQRQRKELQKSSTNVPTQIHKLASLLCLILSTAE